jgi:hypothetical protein
MKNKNLSTFLNKICTVFTVQTNRDFKAENPSTFPQPIFHYFVGKILEIDDNGILMQQWNSNKKLKSYFFINHVVSISEEEILDPTNADDMKIIEEYKKINEKAISSAEKTHKELKEQQKAIRENPEIDINSLINLSQKINNPSNK